MMKASHMPKVISLCDEIDKRQRAKVLRQAIKAIKRIQARELAQNSLRKP